MTKVIGYHASHEQHAPSALLKYVQLAESAGFRAAMCSDHFHPWSEEQGQAGYAWSWLGAALQATALSFGTVTAPGWRYNPAIVAQAAATLSEMYPRRLWLACGSGEALNEHITGQPWPTQKEERNAHLKECVDVIRALWDGETVTHHGRVHVDEAKLYTLPASKPMLFGAALTEATAEWIGGWADGMITVAGPPEGVQKMIDAFRRGGGDGKPIHLQAALSYARDEAEARRNAHQQWRSVLFSSEILASLRMPAHFTEAGKHIREEDVAEGLRVSSDLMQHAEWIQQDLELGVDAVYAFNVGKNQEEFIEAFGSRVLPQLLSRD